MSLTSSLLQWLATFQLDGRPAVVPRNSAYYDLADGYICARVLNQISPPNFPDKWLDGIKPVPPDGSWRLRVSNLKRILQKVHDYASDLQASQFRPSAITPDVVVIAQNFDPDQICRLIQLILFCAINCDMKQEYIEKIRDLPTQVKQDIKEAIEELLVKSNDQRPNPDQVENDSVLSGNEISPRRSSSQTALISSIRPPSHKSQFRRDSTQSESYKHNDSNLDISSSSNCADTKENIDEVRQKLSALTLIKDEKAQACHELEIKLKQLQQERDQLAFENERLLSQHIPGEKKTSVSRRGSQTSRVSENLDNVKIADSEDKNSKDLILQQNMRLQNEIQRLKEEIIKVESEKDDYRLKTNLLREDLDRVTNKHEELKNRAEQAKRLQDELDEHRHISEKVISYETMMENLVKKNNDMKRELKSLEDKNSVHIQNIVRLEQENLQLTNTVNQVELYRKQLNEAHIKLSQETHRADKAEVELNRAIEKLEATKKDNERLFEATNKLMQSSLDRNQPNDPSTVAMRAFESVDLKGGSSSQNRFGLSRDIFVTQQDSQALNSFTTPSVELKEKIVRLEIENELLRTNLDSKIENKKMVVSRMLDEATERCKRLESENRQSRKKIMMLESNLNDLRGGVPQPSTSSAALIQDSSSDNVTGLIRRVEDLQRALYQKEQELREAEVKYKKNLEKAKNVIKTLNDPSNAGHRASCMSSASSFNSSSLDEANLIRQQLREKEERIIELEREFFEFKKVKEMHERLILTAFYGLTTPLQWKNAERRLERTTLTSPPNTANSSMNINSRHGH